MLVISGICLHYLVKIIISELHANCFNDPQQVLSCALSFYQSEFFFFKTEAQNFLPVAYAYLVRLTSRAFVGTAG